VNPRNPERHTVRTRLESFYQQAAATDAPEVHRLAATVEAWWPAIEAGILTGCSNSRSEGYSRLAKHQGRNALGFRNPVNHAAANGGHVPANIGGPQP
jgi:transposase